MRRAGRDVGEIAAQHSPRAAVQFELDVAAEHEQRGVTSTVHVPRHHRALPSAEHHQLVDVGGVDRSRHSRQHVPAGADELALPRRQHVHAARAGKPADDRDRLSAAHLDGIQDDVRHVGGSLLARAEREGVAGAEPDQAGPGGRGADHQKAAAIVSAHRLLLFVFKAAPREAREPAYEPRRRCLPRSTGCHRPRWPNGHRDR